MSDLTELVDAYLQGQAKEENLTIIGKAEGVWDVMVPSYWKESIAVSIRLGDWNLQAEAFFMRAPEDNRADAYHLLLQRNARSGPWRFCTNEEGDVLLSALVPNAAVNEEELDRLFGTLVVLTDETYVPYMKLGYERGLEEQVSKGGPGLDQPPPWAKPTEGE
jgi:Putative bacterial sensory transduction regulator